MAIIQKIVDIDYSSIQKVFGQLDKNIQKIEKTFNISYVYRNDELIISGEEKQAEKAVKVINDIYNISKSSDTISDQQVDYAISLVMDDSISSASDLENKDGIICHTLAGRPIMPKTFGQKAYV